jgi:D-amino-acid dehydrogenase
MLLVAATDDEALSFAEAQAAILARQAARGAPSTIDLHPVSPAEAQALFPPLANVVGALYDRCAARVDGRLLTQALQRAANGQGLYMLYGSVDALATQGSRVTGVRVGPDTLAANAVIVAGGAWSPALGEPLGLRIPVEPQRGQIAHLLLPNVPTGDWPIVGAFRGHYIVPWADGRVAVGATRETGSGFQAETSAAGVREVLSEALRVAPGLASAQLGEVRVGLRPLPPDGLPVLGLVPGWDGLLLATGHGPTGLQLGPFSGRIVAELAQGKPPAADISAFSIARFG